MIHLLFFLSLSMGLSFPVSETVSVQWLTPTGHDFGDIKQGKPVFYEFQFRNTSIAPIIIANVRTTCGCTAPDWQETPVLPDSTASVNIAFDARKKGYFNKQIKVYFHGRRKAYKLFIEGYVKK